MTRDQKIKEVVAVNSIVAFAESYKEGTISDIVEELVAAKTNRDAAESMMKLVPSMSYNIAENAIEINKLSPEDLKKMYKEVKNFAKEISSGVA